MAEPKKSDKVDDAVSETKGIAEQFIQTLGLVDLILGGLALYWARLWYGPSLADLFPPTSYSWVDIALLACGAAFVGKVISLLAELIAALVDVLMGGTEHHSSLKNKLVNYRTKLQQTDSINEWDKIDLATTYLVRANPQLRPTLERLHSTSTIAYSMSLLSLLFAIYYWSKVAEAPANTISKAPILLLFACAAGAFLLAVLTQDDLVVTLRDNLEVLLPTAGHNSQSPAQEPIKVAPLEVNPIKVQVSAADVIRVALGASAPIALELSRKPEPMKEGSMNIILTTDERLKVRQATQFLAALSILRDALAMSETSASNVSDRLGQVQHGDQQAITQVREAGKKLLEGREGFNVDSLPINGELQDLIIQSLLKQPPDETGLELLSLTDGSLRGRIREILEGVRERVRKGLSAAKDLLPSFDGRQFGETASFLIQEMNLPEQTRTLAAGLMAIAASMLRRTFKEMKVSDLTVTGDVDNV